MSQPLGVGHALVLDHADRLAGQGRLSEAIAVLRPSLQGPGAPWQIRLRLSELYCAAGMPDAAVAVLEGPAARADADIHLITAYGAALQAAGRQGPAVAAFERGVAALPASGGAEQNLAMALCEGHWFAECEASTDRALAKGADTPDLWLTRARALQGLGQLDEADRAFHEALRRGAGAEALAELAQLTWMRTEDARAALADLDAALSARPGDAALVRAKANVLLSVGDRPGAYDAYARALARGDADQTMHADAAVVATWLDPAVALAHGARAVQGFPQSPQAHLARCQAHLAAGQPQPALAIAERLAKAWPNDQFVIALIALAWRLMGDYRYRRLHDYERLVRAQPLATPAGWSSLESFLSDLRSSLQRLHGLRGHPIGQSLRHGAQTPQCLTRVSDPVIQAFLEAVDPPIRAYLEAVRADGETLGRAWKPGQGYRIERAWSVLLRPAGFHVDHLHPRGWVSSACHIDVPQAVAREPQGWLKFGEPGVATTPRLPAEHRVQPKAGWLVLFPSYMWHGTVPFAGAEGRLSAAMDVIPA